MMKIVLLLIALLYLSLGDQVKFLETNQRRELPSGWTQTVEPSPETILRITFVLKIKDEDRLEKLFWTVSNPDSPNYTKYVNLQYIIDNHSPDVEDLGKVYKWLASFGLTVFKMPPTRDFLTVDVPVKIAEKMFGVKYYQFYHSVLGSVIRTLDPYSVPVDVASVVSFATGVNRFPSRGRITKVHSSKRHIEQDDGVSPQVIWSTFGTNGETGKAPNNTQGVAQFLEQYFDPQDLSDFQQHFKLNNQPASKVIGPNDPTNPGTEALLDIEYIIGTAPAIPTWFWSTAGRHESQEPFVQWAQDMNAAATVPYVMSVSYGDEEKSITKDYTDRLNIEFQKLAVRGVSILYASGDNGVGCQSGCVHDPNWPASSPYVTAVGGFYGDGGSLAGDGISSGGFSNYYSLAPYQTNAVQSYLSNTPNLPPSNQYNHSGRAMPDVSSFSEDVLVYQDGEEVPVGGTSCASPVFAAIISLINDNLLQRHLNPLGFLNQALYKIGSTNPDAFLDVTTGSNGSGCCKGFPATKGWDPITGWGGPNYPVLKQALMSLQEK